MLFQDSIQILVLIFFKIWGVPVEFSHTLI